MGYHILKILLAEGVDVVRETHMGHKRVCHKLDTQTAMGP